MAYITFGRSNLTYNTLLSNQYVRDIGTIFLASFALALAAPIAIQLPFSPVPITLQNSLALYIGLVLGPRRGALAVLLYLLQGAMGMPVFAFASGGFLRLLGPTGGYLIGYVLGAFATGWIYEKSKTKSVATAFIALAVGNAIEYALGASRLAFFVGVDKALTVGVLPFLLGDLFKMLLLVKAKGVWARVRDSFFPTFS